TSATRHQPRLARAGDRWVAVFRLSAGRGPDRRRHGAASCGGVPGPLTRRGLRPAESKAHVLKSTRVVAPRTIFRKPAGEDLVGCRLERHGDLGGNPWDEPAELDAQERRNGPSLPCAAGGADPQIPRRLEGGRP